MKHIDLALAGAQVEVTFTVAPGDVTEPLGLPADATPSVSEAVDPRAAAYVRGWLVLPRCPAGDAAAAPGDDGRFLVVRWTATCEVAPAALRLDLTRFFALDARHEAVVTVHRAGARGEPAIVRASQPVVELAPGAPPSFAAWIGYGMDHIYGGLDHVLFVVALLLVVVLARDGDGWAVRRPLAALRSTAVVVTGFTLAHSVSLIAASLGWIALPGALVESLIAASIIYTAIENVARPDVRWRFALTIAFGLVHGLGFASMLAELLPADDVLVPLLAFNLGVELGQLSIVALVLPLLWGLARVVGGTRYRRVVLVIAAVPLCVIGLVWLVERVGV